MKVYRVAAYLILGLLLPGPASWAAQPETLNSLSRVASLSAAEAARNLPVKITGTVTYCDRERAILFLQESKDAIFVRLPLTREKEEPELQAGELVEVVGTTTRGRVRCTVRGRARRVIGRRQLPLPLDLTSGNVFDARAEDRLIQVRGWVPTVSTGNGRLNFKLILGPDQSIDVTLDSTEARQLPGALIEATGVISFRLDATGKISGAQLYVNDVAAVHKLKTLPVSLIVDAEAHTTKGESEPIRVRGTVVNHSLGQYLIVRDTSGSVRVPYRALTYFNPGSQVELFAYPPQRSTGSALRNVTVSLVAPDTSNEEPAAAILTPSAPNTNLITLNRIAQVRTLSPREASRGYPVDVTGVVTFFDNPAYLHFVQDESSGIYFDLARVDAAPELKAGQRIQLKGFSAPGDFAPIIVSQSVLVLENSSLPVPQSASFARVMSGNFDSQWVSLRGVVREQWLDTNSSTLGLFAGEGLLKVALPTAPPAWRGTNLVDASVEIHGVCRTIFDERRRLQGVELEVPDWDQVMVREPAVANPFTLPVKAVNNLFEFQAGSGELHRIRLMGVVTLRSSDGSFYLQDGSGGIEIQPQGTVGAFQVGAMADVVGFPLIIDKRAMLQAALVHVQPGDTAIDPSDLKPDAPLEDALQATLIRVQGQVLGGFAHGSEEVLSVRFGQRMIDAVLARRGEQDQLDDIQPGTVVRLTGIYLAQNDSTRGSQSFRLLLRSVQDMDVVSRPTWWTIRRTLWVLTALACVLLLALGWVRALRRQVRQRTGELHEEIDHHKRTEAKLESEIAERKRMESEVERTHDELLIASRQAGMAEVATSVLHNVGNVLNSVNVSAGVIADKIRNSKLSNVTRAAEMLKIHAHDLPEFLTHDPKGSQLSAYLARLADHLNGEQTSVLAELESLRKNVEHIKSIVGMQQNYAKVFGSNESVKPTDLVEDALRMNGGALVRHEVRVIREYEPDLPDITVDKHKLLQILVNLICNAKKACDESPHPERLLTVKIARAQDQLTISVIDNGVGIPSENLTRIFNHGFTTRKDGHGFGLHSGALAAKEMGGALLVHSDGIGKGARFTVALPLKT